ncbi:MAG: mntH [Frankiales bacterium]|nr:mntH [Frankiales bacterium]
MTTMTPPAARPAGPGPQPVPVQVPVPVPVPRIRGLRALAAFAGPAFLVSVGYVDPGNWGTDIAAGSQFGPRLLWVLVAANGLALLLQHLSVRVGVATGHDLAAVLGARLPPVPRRAYAVVALSAVLVTETAEFLGLVVALQLLFGLDLLAAVLVGAVLAAALLALGTRGCRPLELAILGLLGVVAGGYVLELWLSRPDGAVLRGLVPGGLDAQSLPVALGVLGAVVMPHNLFLHSGLILSRRAPGLSARRLLRRATVETAVALNLALLVNAAILLMAAAAFAGRGLGVPSLAQAHATLAPLLGPAAGIAFAVALFAAGLAGCATGGMASQMVLDGLVRTPRRPPLLVRRLAALVPAALILASGVSEVQALLLTQVVLSLVLPFVVVPLVVLARDPALMGQLALRGRLLAAAVAVAAFLVGVDVVALALLL